MLIPPYRSDAPKAAPERSNGAGAPQSAADRENGANACLTLGQELRAHPTAVTTVTNHNGNHAMTSTPVPTPRPASTSEKDKHVDDGFATGLVLARWLGVSGKTLSELGKVGIAVRAGRGLYELEESVRRYCEPHPPHGLADGGELFLRTN